MVLKHMYTIVSEGTEMFYVGAFEDSQVWAAHPHIAMLYSTRFPAICVCRELQRVGYKCYVEDITVVAIPDADY